MNGTWIAGLIYHEMGDGGGGGGVLRSPFESLDFGE